jgi:hypothetical protein
METVQTDTGLQCLALLLRFHQVAVDPAQIAHQFSGASIGVSEMLRCAKDLKLKARAVTEDWAGLMKLPLPAIVELKDKSFIIVGKVTDDDALVQNPSENRPQIIKRAEFEYDWTGRVVLMARRASLADVERRFDLTWFRAIGERRPGPLLLAVAFSLRARLAVARRGWPTDRHVSSPLEFRPSGSSRCAHALKRPILAVLVVGLGLLILVRPLAAADDNASSCATASMPSVPEDQRYLFDLPWCSRWSFNCTSCEKTDVGIKCSDRTEACRETFKFHQCESTIWPKAALPGWTDAISVARMDAL